MATERTIDLNISQRLREDAEFRKAYFRSRSRNEIAAQLIKLRKKRKMRQRDLADAVDTRQSAISRLEKADYGSWSNQTLEQIAEVLNARWRHILEPVEDVIHQYECEEQDLRKELTETANFVNLEHDSTPISELSEEKTQMLTDANPIATGNAACIHPQKLQHREVIYG